MKERLHKIPKIVLALLIQLLAFAILAGAIKLAPNVIEPPYPLWVLVMVQGVLAAFLSCRLGLPCWWRIIQFSIPVGLFWAIQLDINPLWALGIFVVIWMIFSNAIKERVPLYLTNQTTREALKKLARKKRKVKFLDLGSGLGGNVAFMSQQPNVRESHGVETAPAPYMVSKILSFFRGGDIFAMDIWNSHLDYYDVVYAFLSPEPMPRLWEKVKEEMLPGSIFVTNSFVIEGVEPSEVWELSDKRKTQLFIYYL